MVSRDQTVDPGTELAGALPPTGDDASNQSRPYHQLLRNSSFALWRPLVGIPLAIIGFETIGPIIAYPILWAGAALRDGSFDDNLQQLTGRVVIDPVLMLYLNVALALAIPVCWALVKVLHRCRPQWLASVKPGIRWRLMLLCVAPAVGAVLVQLFVGVARGGELGGDGSGRLHGLTANTAWLLVVIALTTPFQTAGEEYVFRGYLLQAVGSLVDKSWWKWVAIAMTAVIFASIHLQFDGPVFLDRLAFGLVAAWLAIRTGGLEAGIALHIVNNYVAFGLAIFYGDITQALTNPQASWGDAPATLARAVVYALLVTWVVRRGHVRTSRTAW